MPAIIRAFADPTLGHCFNPSIFILGSPDTFANGYPVVRQGDRIAVHYCTALFHDGAAAPVNNSNTYANGLLVEVCGDPVDCGDIAANGSPDIFAG